MTPSLLIRPVLALFLTAGVSACGMVDSDPNRFENLAHHLASVPLNGEATRKETPAPAQQRPAESTLRRALTVEVMEDVELWDARYGAMGEAGPVVVEAVVDQARAHVQDAVNRPALRQPRPERAAAPHAPRPVAEPARARGGLVQLGAFSSEQSARAAWVRLKDGGAGWALDGLSPTFEAVSVNGRNLVRLKVRAPAAGAAALCAAAGIDDPWCRRTA